MKIYLFVLLVMVAVVAFAFPIVDGDQLVLINEPEFLKLENIGDLEEHNRQRKFTCNFMCALRCILAGYKTAYCDNQGICFCDAQKWYG
ncbi:defensin [Monomorium pharaonis]|uniref:defensin n=1 Tax=Monomorium pharaonis TaxID=307658 RepID=UPI00102E1895|nr:defensin [Monomorium pharaonis]